MSDKRQISCDKQMYVYAAEATGDYEVTELKFSIPELFIDKGKPKWRTERISINDKNFFINKIKPPLSSSITSDNFIILPFQCKSGKFIQIGEKFSATFTDNLCTSGFITRRMGTK